MKYLISQYILILRGTCAQISSPERNLAPPHSSVDTHFAVFPLTRAFGSQGYRPPTYSRTRLVCPHTPSFASRRARQNSTVGTKFACAKPPVGAPMGGSGRTPGFGTRFAQYGPHVLRPYTQLGTQPHRLGSGFAIPQGVGAKRGRCPRTDNGGCCRIPQIRPLRRTPETRPPPVGVSFGAIPPVGV